MKKYLKELIILLLQLLMFYVSPLCAGPTDMMGLVFLIILVTFLLAVLMGGLSNSKLKYIYPVIVAVLFIPSIFIYYNSSALIHSVWYLVVAYVGLLLGMLIRLIIKKVKK